jgi:Putative transposase
MGAQKPLSLPYRDGTTQVAFDPVDFIARLAALVPKPRVNLTRYHGVLAPNHRWRRMVTPAKRGKGVKRIANTEVRSPAERHVAMSWAQRLKRVFNIDIEVCGRCGGSVKVIACIEDQDIIERILAHLESKEQNTPALPHLAPPTRAPPGTYPIKRGRLLPLFAGKDSSSTAFNQQGRH